MQRNAQEGESARDRFKRVQAERIVREMKAASESLKEHLKAEYAANAEVQHTATLTEEERTRRAINRLVACRKEYNDFKEGTDTTLSRAEKEVRELIHKFHRDHNME